MANRKMKFEELLLDLKNNFAARIQNDEWYLSNFIKENLSQIKQEEAFDFINVVVKIIVQENDLDFLSNLMDILNYLVLKADTTEIPNELKKNVDKLNSIVEQNSYCKNIWEDIKKYYLLNLPIPQSRGKIE